MPDPYLLPNGTLRNKLGETDREALDHRVGQLAAARTIQLRSGSWRLPLGMEGLCAIHRHLFADAYNWAGEFRSVDLRKPIEIGKAATSTFTARRNLQTQAQEIDAELRANNYLRMLDRLAFAEAAADLLVRINRLHPFREGNGRTQRFSMKELARGRRAQARLRRCVAGAYDHGKRERSPG